MTSFGAAILNPVANGPDLLLSNRRPTRWHAIETSARCAGILAEWCSTFERLHQSRIFRVKNIVRHGNKPLPKHPMINKLISGALPPESTVSTNNVPADGSIKNLLYVRILGHTINSKNQLDHRNGEGLKQPAKKS